MFLIVCHCQFEIGFYFIFFTNYWALWLCLVQFIIYQRCFDYLVLSSISLSRLWQAIVLWIYMLFLATVHGQIFLNFFLFYLFFNFFIYFHFSFIIFFISSFSIYFFTDIYLSEFWRLEEQANKLDGLQSIVKYSSSDTETIVRERIAVSHSMTQEGATAELILLSEKYPQETLTALLNGLDISKGKHI